MTREVRDARSRASVESGTISDLGDDDNCVCCYGCYYSDVAIVCLTECNSLL